MKKQISLVTSYVSLKETTRIQEEISKMGYIPNLINVAKANFVLGGDLKTPVLSGFNNLNSEYIIARGIFKYLKETAYLLSQMRLQGIKVFDNGFISNPYSINKVFDILKLSLNGLPVPKTVFTREGFAEFKELSLKTFKYPFIVKRVNLGKGAGVYLVHNEKELDSIIKDAELKGKKSKNFIAQQFIDYEHDLRVLLIGDKAFCMKRIPGESEFRANFSLGGSVELFDLDDESKKLALKARDVVGLTVAGVDILIDKKGNKYLLEVNHTPGFIGMEQATGENIGRYFVETALKKAL